ncbi:MAG: thioesterase family protein [Gammaproteobacteria bacterium]|nr:thioesterase family protein [Gammaproteobacteria bacterium]MDP2142391.1 thioesterase family protein [Gammaproteobacteria bacterium]MDP2348632.1 thioesterase family protein [Gammaproteobacteria bacterium]
MSVDMTTVFTTTMAVRDYECDMQGVVNNAVYQHYLEHARHEFLKSRGLDFAKLTEDGIIVVVVRAELDYRRSLRSGDAFTISVTTKHESRLRLTFVQQIVHARTGAIIMDARIITTAVSAAGKPCFPEELAALL